MTPMLSSHFSIFGWIFFVLKSLLGIASQWNREKFAFRPQCVVMSIEFNISNVGY